MTAIALPANIESIAPDVQPYWHSRDQLTVQDGLVLFNARMVVPAAMRMTTLKALHVGHLGVVKSRAKARESVWWPKCSDDIQCHVASCDTCRLHAKDCAEPLLPTALPDLPWQKVGTDLFE